MQCPSCGARLVEIDRSEITIDACPECRGVWLDRGELDRILEHERRVASGVTNDDDDFMREMSGGNRSAPPVAHERDDYPRDRGHRRRGLLEQLLDFE
jgi:Zn-finger nucleic acid-binding protein